MLHRGLGLYRSNKEWEVCLSEAKFCVAVTWQPLERLIPNRFYICCNSSRGHSTTCVRSVCQNNLTTLYDQQFTRYSDLDGIST